MPQLERDIERKCRLLAKAAGGRLIKWTSPGNAGVPDRILLLPQRVAFIEFKRPGAHLTPLQKVWADRLTGFSLEYHCVRSEEQFTEILDAAPTLPRARG